MPYCFGEYDFLRVPLQKRRRSGLRGGFCNGAVRKSDQRNIVLFSVIHTRLSVGVQSPTGIKASGGWQRCADEDVALMCDAHLAGNNAEALLNFSKKLNLIIYHGRK